MAEFRFATPDYNYNGIVALGKGLGDYATGLKSQRDQDVLAKALTKFDGSNYNDVAKALLEAKQPEAALKMFQLGEKTSPSWKYEPGVGFYDANSATQPQPTVAQGQTTATYPPGIDTPKAQEAYDKAKATQAAKQEQLDKEKATFGEGITSDLLDMAGAYSELAKRGALVDPNSSDTWQNVLNYGKATGIGQQIEGARGTPEQANRDVINQIVPSLINKVRQASHMGARGLDSNVELAFYQRQMGNLAAGKIVNYAAMDRLDRGYGNGTLLNQLLKNGIITPQEFKQIREHHFTLPGGIKETQLPEVPYDAGEESPTTAAQSSIGKWTPGSPLPSSPGWYDTPKGKFHYLGNDQWSDQ